MVVTSYIDVRSDGPLDIIDITEKVASEIAKCPVKNGTVTVFGQGSTCAVTTLEYEPGLKKDLKEFLSEIIPYVPNGKNYAHHATWGDDNGSSHLQSALLKTSFTVPIVKGQMTLGTWQPLPAQPLRRGRQIVFIECDTRGRSRKIVLQNMGE